MKKAIKWILVIVGAFLVLIVAAMILIPLFVDFKHYKPEIEKQLTAATGRPVTLGEDLDFSVFPWVGLSFSDLHLGNPPAFAEKDFVSVKAFEVRVKLLPLIKSGFKTLEVKRFVLKEPKITLLRNKDGRANWEGMGKPPGSAAPKPVEKKKEGRPAGESPQPIALESLLVDEFAVVDGSLLFNDQVSGQHKEISDLTLRLGNVSFDEPIRISLSGRLDKKPFSLDGVVGPLGKDFVTSGKGSVALNFAAKALNQLDVKLNGRIENPGGAPRFDLELAVAPFSPRKLLAAVGQSLPVATADPTVLNRVALSARVKGSPENVSVSAGSLVLDDSKMTFSLDAGDFSRPDVTFDVGLDKIDIDRYLPPKDAEKPAEKASSPGKGPVAAGPGSGPEKRKKTDYAPLRRLVVKGAVRADELKVNKARVRNINLKVSGKNGIFDLAPLNMDLYQGTLRGKGVLNVQKDTPRTTMDLQIAGLQVEPLVKDMLERDLMSGTLKAGVSLGITGDTPDMIKQSLTGTGDLLFKDGYILGVDLKGMVHNTQTALVQALSGTQGTRTPFGEFHVPFTMKNGLANTVSATLKSSELLVTIAGDVNLVSQKLDLRVAPQYVAKNEKRKEKYGEIAVPIQITGTFSHIQYRPDLKEAAKQNMEKQLFESKEFKKVFKKEELKPLEDTTKQLLKGLFQ